jgi:hypothetical protein
MIGIGIVGCGLIMLAYVLGFRHGRTSAAELADTLDRMSDGFEARRKQMVEDYYDRRSRYFGGYTPRSQR